MPLRFATLRGRLELLGRPHGTVQLVHVKRNFHTTSSEASVGEVPIAYAPQDRVCCHELLLCHVFVPISDSVLYHIYQEPPCRPRTPCV